MTGGVIVAMDRDRGPASAFATIDAARAARDRGVPALGIGNDGLPSIPLSDVAAPFQYAREHGPRTTAHANKPVAVVHALDVRLDRIAHAWSVCPPDASPPRQREAFVKPMMEGGGRDLA